MSDNFRRYHAMAECESFINLVARQQPQPIDQRQNDLGQNFLISGLMRMTSCNTKGLKAKSQND